MVRVTAMQIPLCIGARPSYKDCGGGGPGDTVRIPPSQVHITVGGGRLQSGQEPFQLRNGEDLHPNPLHVPDIAPVDLLALGCHGVGDQAG